MFTLSPLPYALSALEPHISARTLEFHHGKHHQAYVDNLNKLIAGTELENKTLEEIIISSYKQADQAAIFNNAAQAYNHDFYWQSLSPVLDKPSIEMEKMIITSFGTWDSFVDQFTTLALSQFGSGWIWLTMEAGKLKLIKTANADTPIAHGQKPLLVVDVWEHAYYLDYQNRRGDYVKNILVNLCHWSFADKNLSL